EAVEDRPDAGDELVDDHGELLGGDFTAAPRCESTGVTGAPGSTGSSASTLPSYRSASDVASAAPFWADTTSPFTSWRKPNFSASVSKATKYIPTPPSLRSKISRATSSGCRPSVFCPSVTTSI